MVTVVVVLLASSCGATDPADAGGTLEPPVVDVPTTTSLAPQTTTTSPPATTTVAETTTTTTAPVPSQSPVDAARDGVVAEVAALPFDVRVQVLAAVAVEEGVWVISRPTPAADDFAEGCRIGPETGKYPTEFICTIEYGEVLLLDESQSQIVRAYPLPGVPPELIMVGSEAVHCGRNGELPLPDSMMCRIDRATLAAIVRVYPPGLDSVIVQPCFYPPDNWLVDDEMLEVLELGGGDGALHVRAADGSWTRLDPVTLEVTERGLEVMP